MENSLSIYGINGPLVTVKGKTDLKMSEMVYVGKEKLVGEVIRLSPELATIQVFEETCCIRRAQHFLLPWHPASCPISLMVLNAPLPKLRKNPVNISTEASLWILWILTGNGRRSCV